jgi:hypothetical protein
MSELRASHPQPSADPVTERMTARAATRCEESRLVTEMDRLIGEIEDIVLDPDQKTVACVGGPPRHRGP